MGSPAGTLLLLHTITQEQQPPPRGGQRACSAMAPSTNEWSPSWTMCLKCHRVVELSGLGGVQAGDSLELFGVDAGDGRLTGGVFRARRVLCPKFSRGTSRRLRRRTYCLVAPCREVIPCALAGHPASPYTEAHCQGPSLFRLVARQSATSKLVPCRVRPSTVPNRPAGNVCRLREEEARAWLPCCYRLKLTSRNSSNSTVRLLRTLPAIIYSLPHTPTSE